MDFQHPWYLILLLILPLAMGWYRTSGRNKEGTLRISSSTFISEEFKTIGNRKHMFLRTLYLLVLFLVILGLARPRLIDNLQETSVSVIDMLLVLDISSSMLADDFPPNRLEAVK